MPRHLVVVSFAGVALALFGGACVAQTTWTGVLSTDWAIAGNWSAGVPSATDDAVIPSGTPNQPSTTGVGGSCRDLTINAGATVTVAPGSPLHVNRSGTLTGAIGGGGLVRFVGLIGGTVSAASTISASVEIAKSGIAQLTVGSSWTVTGDLTQTSGTFVVAQSSSFVVSVSGFATFSGGTLQPGTFPGTIDVAGNVTFSGTTVSTAPVIRCAATWTSSPPFGPTTGSVVLDGTGAQTISGTGTFPSLTIAATSSATRVGAMLVSSGLTVNGSLTQSGGTLQVNGATTINGTLSMPSSTLDANGAFTIAPTGSVDLGAGTHTFGGSYTASGSLTATGLFVFDSPIGGTVSTTTSFPSVQISKSIGATVSVGSAWTVTGNLALVAGTFSVSAPPGFTVSVLGNATFSGGALAVPVIGTIAVTGNVTFSGASVSGTSPTIRCGGTWTSNAAYAPTAGSVVLDGTGAQTISGAGTFPGLTIAATSAATRAGAMLVSGALTVNGSLSHSGGTVQVNGATTVNGTLTMPSSTLDANGSFTIAAAGSVDLGSGTHTFGASYNATGSLTATGLFVFDSATLGTVSAAVPFPAVQISKSGATAVTVGSNWTVNGNLALTSGTFSVSAAPGFTVSVAGNATFSGGTLGVPVTGTIDVAGNVTFSGTSVSGSTPTISCGGTWTSDAAYAPTVGSVVLDGTGGQGILGAGSFPGLTIAATSSVARAGAMIVSGALTVSGSLSHSGGTLQVNGATTVNGTLSMPSSTLDANGSFTVAGTGSAALGAGTHSFGGSYAATGSVTASGLFVFDSATLGTVSATASLPSVQVSKVGVTALTVGSDWTVNGNLTLTSGTFSVSGPPGFTVSVLGNAAFSGGTLGVPVTGTIDVAGSVTFSGTSVTGLGPTIRCAGNWTSDAAYTPSSALVVLDGASPQTLSAAGAFATLTIAAGASVTSAGALVVDADLTVDGALSVATAALDVNGNFAVSATGSANLGAGTHNFARDYTVLGSVTATGTFVFDSNTLASGTTVAPLPSIEIAKTGGAPLIVGSSWTVNGNLTLTSGGLNVAAAPAFVVAVSGNATFAGGSLGAPTTGTIDVEGDVTFSGTTTSAVSPTIRCAGNWTSDGGFVATSGIVELDGTVPTTFAGTTGSLQVGTLEIRNATRSPSPGLTVSASTITIESTGAIVLDPGEQLHIHRVAGPTTFTIQGGVTLGSGSELALGPQTAATVSPSGLLSLIGSVDFPARLAGAAGGGYGLTIDGTIAAKNFLMKDMGAAGVVINASATIAAAPNDFRGGTLDFRPGAPAGSVLLDVRRAAPTDIRYTRFLNTPSAAGVFNVRTVASSAPVGFTNWTGSFSGASFENDPNNLVAWNLPEETTLAFIVQPGAEVSEITWSNITFVDYEGFALRRATSPAGPWVEIFSTNVVAAQYGWVDQPLVANQTYYYELHQQLTHDPFIVLASATSLPYSSAPPYNVYKVGVGAPYATIQAAVDAAVQTLSTVWVTPGTYAPFSIGPTAPSNLRIVGDGSGPIFVDTTSGPIQIANVPPTSGIEIGNMVIGSTGTAQSAIVISNSLCPVVLDELVVASAPSHAAISVSGSFGAAIQRSDVQGGPGVLATDSYVALSRGSLSSLDATNSTLEMTELVPGSVNVTPAGSLIAHAGPMPNVHLPDYTRLSFGGLLSFDGFPGQPFLLFLSPRLAILAVPTVIEMPVLFDLSLNSVLPLLPTDPFGHFEAPFELPPDATLLGANFVIQAATLNPSTGGFRLSNVATMVALP